MTLVVADHAGVPGLGGGYVGVDLFFVISGYVITRLLLDELGGGIGSGLAAFYSRRIRRIVPAATATLMITLLLSAVVMGTAMDPNLPGDVRWASLFGANWRLTSTGAGYFVAGLQPSLVTQFWSLGVEEQFYLCFPLTVFVVGRFVAPPRRLLTLRWVVLVGILASAWWSLRTSASEPTAAYYLPFTRFWELGLGCLLATAPESGRRRTARAERLAGATALAALILAVVTLGPHSVYPGWQAALPCSSAVLLLWAGAGGPRTELVRFLSWRPLASVGNLSYSIYLFHYLWLVLPEQLASPLTSWPWRLAELVGTYVTAQLSYRLIENPLRRSKLLSRDGVSVVLLLLVCIVACWGAAAWAPHLT